MKSLPVDFYSRRVNASPRDYTAFAEFVSQHAPSSPRPWIVDVGVGSGEVLQTILRCVPARAIALDRDLSLARDAARRFQSVLADFDRTIPLSTSSVDAVVLSFVLHLAGARSRLLAECRRILMPGGHLFILTASERQIAARFLNRFFPALQEIDRNRYPTMATLQCELEEAGLRICEVKSLYLGDILLDQTFVDALESASWSSFALLDEEDRREGMRQLRAFLHEQPAAALPIRTAWKRTAIAARVMS